MNLRRISTKLVLAVLAAVVLPFGGFAVYVDQYVSWRSLEVVKQALLGLATDLTREIDQEIEDLRRGLELWTAEPRTLEAIRESHRAKRAEAWGVAETIRTARGESGPEQGRNIRRGQTLAFDRYVANQTAYDLLLLIDVDGRLVVSNSRASDGTPLSEELLERIFAANYTDASWFADAISTGRAQVDQHRSELIGASEPAELQDRPATFHVGLARAVKSGAASGSIEGVVFGLVNWRTFHDLLQAPLVKDYFRGMVPKEVVPSPYAWIWGADADTILAHQDPSLMRERVSGPRVGLWSMVEDARRGAPGRAGLFREYEFNGVRKNAAFNRCALTDAGGFGWYVGVGINNDDIYAATTELTEVLYKGSAIVLLAGVLWMMVIARRTTIPILALQEHTRRVAEGDLNTRISIKSKDELGELADAFNRMTHDLAENRTALIKAEKDAAWREMARQIAHDIKNPLTPIKLSLDLLRRARAEGREDFEMILDRTMGLMERQVQNLREIATDFFEFTGGRKPRPDDLEVDTVLREVIELHRAWAESKGIEVELRTGGEHVWADAGKLRRVLTNLVSNAFQAMPDGGRLDVQSCTVSDAKAGRNRVQIEFLDTGTGLSADARERLFEPFFTTRSEGTGLGLAIAKRVMEEMDGSIDLIQREDESGTRARIGLPLPPSGASA